MYYLAIGLLIWLSILLTLLAAVFMLGCAVLVLRAWYVKFLDCWEV